MQAAEEEVKGPESLERPAEDSGNARSAPPGGFIPPDSRTVLEERPKRNPSAGVGVGKKGWGIWLIAAVAVVVTTVILVVALLVGGDSEPPPPEEQPPRYRDSTALMSPPPATVLPDIS
jgi:hypothetical protein